MEKEKVGLAGEFATASELCRRGLYAQPTFGHLKRTDLLIFGKDNRPIRIEAKGKQSKSWPNCKGTADRNTILVFVDFTGKIDLERPDLRILTADDWLAFFKKMIQPVWTKQVNKSGKSYSAMGMDIKDVLQHKEAWGKIMDAINEQPNKSERSYF